MSSLLAVRVVFHMVFTVLEGNFIAGSLIIFDFKASLYLGRKLGSAGENSEN